MKILILILARGGSKRLPNKNILKLGKKHLINWSIDFAKKIPFVYDILVSTDSKKIGLIAKKRGALVPWIRPKKLSLDKTKSHDAAIHAINWYENNIQKVDALMLLQPTSPFRRLKTIKEGIRIFKNKKNISVIGVERSKYNSNNYHILSKTKNKSLKKLLKNPEAVYRVNGSFYLISPSNLRKNKSFYYNNTFPLVCKSMIESIDIDTKDDWKIAKKLVNIKFN
jgi:CMP-N-acetylneuraminic acid synthetase